MNRLYFIAAINPGTGDSADLFVAAIGVPEAIQAWQEYYELELTDVPDRVFAVPTIEETNPSSWCFAKALAWHDDIEQVGGTE